MSPGISHQNESHDGEEHEREKDEEGEVDGTTDVVGKGGRGNSELFGRHSTSTCTVSTSVVVPKVWNTHCEVSENRTKLVKNQSNDRCHPPAIFTVQWGSENRPFENQTICPVFECLGLKYYTIDVYDVDFSSHLEFTI